LFSLPKSSDLTNNNYSNFSKIPPRAMAPKPKGRTAGRPKGAKGKKKPSVESASEDEEEEEEEEEEEAGPEAATPKKAKSKSKSTSKKTPKKTKSKPSNTTGPRNRRNAAETAMTALDRLAEAGEVEEEDEHGEDENFAANAPSSIWHESKPVNALFASVNAGAHGVETELAKDLFDLFASIKPPLRCRIMTSHELGARERHHHMHGLFEVTPSPPNNHSAPCS
jgi:hypothetical protein